MQKGASPLDLGIQQVSVPEFTSVPTTLDARYVENKDDRWIHTIWIETLASHVSSTQIVGAIRHNPRCSRRNIPIVRSRQGGIGRDVSMFAEVKFLVSMMMILTSSTDQPTSENGDQREGGCSKKCHCSNYPILDSIRLTTDRLSCKFKNVVRK